MMLRNMLKALGRNSSWLICVALFSLFLPVQTLPGNAEAIVTYRTLQEVNQLIQIGDSYSEVMKKLGNATHNDVAMKKESPTIIGRRVMYIYRRIDPDSFNAKNDTYLNLWFSPEDILQKIDYNQGALPGPTGLSETK